MAAGPASGRLGTRDSGRLPSDWCREPSVAWTTPGEALRLYLAAYCAVSETYPTLTISVDQHVLATVPIAGPGDHYWEFLIPNGLGEAQHALVTLSFAPHAQGVSVRSIGIYAPADEPEARVSTARASACQVVSEQVFWIANVERECARMAAVIAELEAERAAQISGVVGLQSDLEGKVAWARSLQAEVERTRAALAQLRAEFDERTAWALSLREDVEAARSAWERSQSELHYANDHPWRLVANKLRRKLKLGRR